MKILVLDNYDSFVYNLAHYLEELTKQQIDVFRNDEISIEEVAKYDKILLSPGPGVPKDAGIMPELIQRYATTKSILGICLGEQAIGEAFGGRLINLEEVYHGVATTITITGDRDVTFKNIPKTIEIGRYHSWIVDKNTLPDVLEMTSVDENGYLMSLKHKTLDVRGVQFHPESVLTPHGKEMIKNWLLS